MPKSEKFQSLPAPWDRIFSMFTRLFVWSLMIGILYILRPFFLLIFLTFVFAYVQSHGVDGLSHRFKSRVTRVIFVFMVFLGLIVGTGYFLAPHIKEQAQTFADNWEDYKTQADKAIFEWAGRYPSIGNLIYDNQKPAGKNGSKTNGGGQDPGSKEPEKIIEPFVSELFGVGGSNGEKDVHGRLSTLLGIGSMVGGFTSSFLLSILFSFLIVLDLPKLAAGIRGLADTRLDFIYEEAAANIHEFGKVLGRALEAQLFIAICNTILTSIGVWIMGLDSIVFLATIVFFCSFIPVAGVFISSAPICLLALQAGGENFTGVQMMMIAIGLILVIHFVEVYFLNPKIFGHHLHMNAVLVLIVLTIAGKIFGVWGLILCLPVVNYIFVSAIRQPRDGHDESAHSPVRG